MKKTIEEQIAELTLEQQENILKIYKKYAAWQIIGSVILYLLGIICYIVLPDIIGLGAALLCGGAFIAIGLIWVLGVLVYVKKRYPYYSEAKVKYLKSNQNKGNKKRNNAGKAILLFVVMFAVTMGQNAQTLFNLGMDFDSVYSTAMINTLITMALLSAVMLVVPFVCRMVKGGRLENEKGKKICLWNSVVLFAASSLLLTLELPIPVAVGGVGAVCFYFINKWFFVDA